LDLLVPSQQPGPLRFTTADQSSSQAIRLSFRSWRRSALFVTRILQDRNPAYIPVEQPTKFELLINIETAKTLGLTVPPALLARADEVIE
jgi:ABC transporter substrate binding protein